MMNTGVSRRSFLLGGSAVAASTLLIPSAMADSTNDFLTTGNEAANMASPNHIQRVFPTITAASDINDVMAVQYLITSGGAVSLTIQPTWTDAVTTAVKTFQANHSLPQTGIADPATLLAATTTVNTGMGKCNITTAIRYLLHKHGYIYGLGDAPAVDAAGYDGVTDAFVKAFQAGHGIKQQSYVGYYTWRTLFGPCTSGPLYPLMQYQTGNAQWNNCGPASSVMLDLYVGKVPPKWTYSADTRAVTISNWRTNVCKVPSNPSRDGQGVNTTFLIPGLTSQGISSSQSTVTAAITAAKSGKPSIVAGDSYRLSWNKSAPSFDSGPASHWIVLAGWDGNSFIVLDPLSYPSKNTVHNLTEAELRNYAAFYGSSTIAIVTK